MPTDLKPCPMPKCGSEDLFLSSWGDVHCRGCGIVISFDNMNAPEAAVAWNSLPRALTDDQKLAIAHRMVGLVYGTNEMGYEYPNDGELLACFEEPEE